MRIARHPAVVAAAALIALVLALAPGEAAARPIVEIRVEGQDPGRVLTLGHPFRPGDWPRGARLVAQADGAPIPLQAEPKTRWPDGSVRHAALTLRLPARPVRRIALGAASEPAAPAAALDPARALLNRGFDLTLTLRFPDRTRTVDLRAALERARRAPDFWLRGPLASELRATAPIEPGLRVVVDVRASADGAAQLGLTVASDALFASRGKAWTYDAALTAGGVEAARWTAIAHHPYAAWRELVWLGRPRPAAHLALDPGYLVATGMVPAVDWRIADRAAQTARIARAFAGAPTGPLEPARITRDMWATGYRDELGLAPAWSLSWLATQSPEAWAAMIESAEAAGAIPWRMVDPRTGRPPLIADRPRLWLDRRARPAEHGIGPIAERAGGWRPDIAHQPSLSALAYLATADRFHLDQLLHQASWTVLSVWPAVRGGRLGLMTKAQVRAQGWAIRTLAEAATLAPDGDPLKAAFDRVLRNRLHWYLEAYVRRGAKGAPPGAETVGWIDDYRQPLSVKPFMQAFFTLGVGYAAQLGYADAARVLEWSGGFFAGRYVQSAFDPLQASRYAWRIERAPGQALATWAEIGAANAAAGVFKPGLTALDGYPHLANQRAASERAALAQLAAVTRHPRAAAAYAFAAARSRAMERGPDGFGALAQWAIAPRFADGALLSIRDHRYGGPGADRLTAGDARPMLLFGDAGDDRLTAGAAHAYLIGWDGDDLLDARGGGPGRQTRLHGGRGDDVIRVGAGVHEIAGGPGADRFEIGADTGRATIHDFEPARDALILPPGARRSAERGGVRFALPGGGAVSLPGVSAAALDRADAPR